MKSNKQDYDDKMMKLAEYFKTILAAITDHINTLKSSPNQKDSTKSLEPTTVLPANRRDSPLDSGHSTKMVACGI